MDFVLRKETFAKQRQDNEMGILSFENQMYILIGVLLVLLIVCLSMVIVLCVRFEKLKKRQLYLYDNMDMEPLDVLLENCLLRQNELTSITEESQKKLEQLLSERRKTFDKIAVVRYSSNSDDIDELNFSVGITNMDSDGIVITGLQQTTGTKLSVKSIKGGKSGDDLSDEELYAIQRKKAKYELEE